MFEKIKAYLKGALKSWTVWFNSVVGVGTAALPILQDSFPQLQDYLPAHMYHYGIGLLAVGNIILRIKTGVSLAQKGQQ